MVLRHYKGKRPQVTFTSDFHELVQGDLVPGPCVIRYDPLRLVPAQDRGAERRIRAHVRLHPGGREWQAEMLVPPKTPLAQLADPTGQGFMLEAAFDLPPGCEEFEAWFSWTHPDGHVAWDSEFGQNYWVRFPLHDLDYEAAAVIESPHEAEVSGILGIALTSVMQVDGVDVRWRLTSPPNSPRTTTSLRCISTEGRRKHWTTPEGIRTPRGATVAFDVVYRVGAHEYTDDNQGQWLITERNVTPDPEPVDGFGSWIRRLSELARWLPLWQRWRRGIDA